jgi:hypothetical protein
MTRDELVREMNRAPRSRAGPTPSRSPSATASTCSRRAFARPWASRCYGDDLAPSRGGHGAGAYPVGRSRHAQRLLRAPRGGGYVDIEPDREALARFGLRRRRATSWSRARSAAARHHHRRGAPGFTVNAALRRGLPHEPRGALRAIVPLPMRGWRRGGRVRGLGSASGRWRGWSCARLGPPMIRDEGGCSWATCTSTSTPARTSAATSRRARRRRDGARDAGTLPCPRDVAGVDRPVRAAREMEARMKLLVPLALARGAAALRSVPQLHRGAHRAPVGALRAGGQRVGAVPARLPSRRRCGWASSRWWASRRRPAW